VNDQREDGPALQKLFGKLDGPAKFDTVIPDEVMALIGDNSDVARPALGRFIVIAPPAEEGGRAHAYTIHIDGRIEGFPEGSVVDNGILPLLQDEPDDGDSQVVGPVNYAKKLHQAGEAAIAIAANSCEVEFAYGNPCNIPEPIIGWYTMTLAYQLLLFEAVERPYDERLQHAEQLAAARKAFSRHDTPYATAVKADVAEALNTRYTPTNLQKEDLSYGGVIPAPPAPAPKAEG
jgi:hypothetical protein